jgi:hypothetical protein
LDSSSEWLEEVMASYQKDDYSKEIIAKLTADGTGVPDFKFTQGLLRYKSRIWVGADSELQLNLIFACHSSTVGGHSGIPVTY